MDIIIPSPRDWKEARRLHAYTLKQEGWIQREIADIEHVSEAAVSQWMSAVEAQGLTELLSRPHPGAPPRLARAQLHLLPDFLSHGPEAYGFVGEVWTCARVAVVIEREFAVSYHPAHVSRLLEQLDWTPQKPMQRAQQRDERLIEQWRLEGWKELYRQARLERRTPVFVDESGFYLLPGVVRTYAPRGKTPVLRPVLTHAHLSVMGAITPQGHVYLLIQKQALDSSSTVIFLEQLRQQLRRKLLVIWDSSPIHRAAEVKDFLAEGAAKQIHLEALPPYAPDLNPTEGVWQHLKHVDLPNRCHTDLDHLESALDLATRRLWKKPQLVKAFFAGAGLDLWPT